MVLSSIVLAQDKLRSSTESSAALLAKREPAILGAGIIPIELSAFSFI